MNLPLGKVHTSYHYQCFFQTSNRTPAFRSDEHRRSLRKQILASCRWEDPDYTRFIYSITYVTYLKVPHKVVVILQLKKG